MTDNELDEWTYEHIIGECVHDWEWRNEPRFPRDYCCQKCNYSLRSYTEDLPNLTPPYSTDIGLAMGEVLPRVTKNEIEWSIEFSKHGWFVTIDSPDGHTYTLNDNYPAKMICEHAKRAYQKGWLNDA